MTFEVTGLMWHAGIWTKRYDSRWRRAALYSYS